MALIIQCIFECQVPSHIASDRCQQNAAREILSVNYFQIISFQKETPSDIQLHLAAIRGDEVLLRKLLDSGRVHVDCKDEVSHSIFQNEPNARNDEKDIEREIIVLDSPGCHTYCFKIGFT